MRPSLPTIVIIALAATPLRAAAPVEGMVELTLKGQRIEGRPLAWDDGTVRLLGRDGRLWQFDPRDATNFRKTSSRFRSYSPAELRASLLGELGQGFEVSGTGHYLIAHPRGQRDQWAQRFEDLYRDFVQYFSVRGFQPTPPPFPLLGVVCRDRQEFRRAMAAEGIAVPEGVLGFYAFQSNRIMLYDTAASPTGSRWDQASSVIIHEATHQIAFNTGVHNRYAHPPLWVAEGLATLFEAPGVYDAHRHPMPAERINRGRFEAFRSGVAPRHRPELLASIVAADDLFHRNTGTAYAEAWALTYFLVETQPRKYARYLAVTAARPSFSPYTAAQRTADFTSVFGRDWRMLEAQFLRFLGDLK
jgi:hypothetical protein